MRYYMFKKISILLVLLLLLISISAVSAIDDANETVMGSDEAILDEVDSTDVLTSTNEDVVSSGSHTITASNYANYFNSKGDLISTSVKDGDTIVIGDNFNNKKFNFEKSINIVGSGNVKLKNCMFTFTGGASGSSISNLNIANTKDTTYGIFLNGVCNCTITNCFINNTGTSSYTICVANNANYNNVTNNNLNEYGITYGHGTRSTPPIVISGAHHNYIANNAITCDDANGIYLSSFAGGPLKGGESNYNFIYNISHLSWTF